MNFLGYVDLIQQTLLEHVLVVAKFYMIAPDGYSDLQSPPGGGGEGLSPSCPAPQQRSGVPSREGLWNACSLRDGYALPLTVRQCSFPVYVFGQGLKLKLGK